MGDSWTTIPTFPGYQINVEGEVRYNESKEQLPVIDLFGAECYVLVLDGTTYKKTKQHLIDVTNPHIKRWQGVPVSESK